MKRVGLGLAIILLASFFGCCISDVEDTTESVETNARGSLSNPGSIGEPVVVKTSSGTFEITVVDAIRGEKAYQIVKRGNKYNPEPEKDYEYLLVKVRLRYLSGDSSYYVSRLNFNAYCDGAGYSPKYVTLPNNYPEFKSVNLMPGGKIEGWILYTVPKNRNVLIGYEDIFEPACFIRV